MSWEKICRILCCCNHPKPPAPKPIQLSTKPTIPNTHDLAVPMAAKKELRKYNTPNIELVEMKEVLSLTIMKNNYVK